MYCLVLLYICVIDKDKSMMRRCLYQCVIMTMVVMMVVGCKNEEKNPRVKGAEGTYVIGKREGHSLLWKEGMEMKFSDGMHVSDVYVSNGDIYIVGVLSDDAYNYKAILWKNGEQIILSEGYSRAGVSSVTISGNDVYIAGFMLDEEQNSVATLWKNGKMTFLNNENKDTYGYSVAVAGEDVYVAGVCKNIEGTEDVVLWKNGEVTVLYEGGVETINDVKVSISSGDVYVVANAWHVSSDYSSFAWKNGAKSFFEGNELGVCINDVFAVGNDVYMSGYTMDDRKRLVATLWKNGKMIQLYDGEWPSRAKAVFVAGDYVYVAGEVYENSKTEEAKLWKMNIKSGKIQTIELSDDIVGAEVTGLFVVEE